MSCSQEVFIIHIHNFRYSHDTSRPGVKEGSKLSCLVEKAILNRYTHYYNMYTGASLVWNIPQIHKIFTLTCLV